MDEIERKQIGKMFEGEVIVRDNRTVVEKKSEKISILDSIPKSFETILEEET